MGVKLYHDEPIVHEWFAPFNLFTSKVDVSVSAVPQIVDFRTGCILQGLPAANQTALSSALQRYAAVLQKYPQLESGYNLPEPIPEDLYMPFDQFVQKYDVGDAIQFINGINGALGDILERPTLQEFRGLSLGLPATLDRFQTSSVLKHSFLFEKATAELLTAKSLFLSSQVLATEHVSESDSVKILVDTPGDYKLIIAKKLLITIPPTPAGLIRFDTDQDELSIFSHFQGTGYYTSTIRNAGPVNVTLQNLALDKPYTLPPCPPSTTSIPQ